MIWTASKFNNTIQGAKKIIFTACHSGKLKLQPVAKVLETLPYFGINGLSMILCLWSPLHPLSKLLAIQDHTQNLEEQLWMGGRREVSIIFYRPVTRSDLKRERSFFRVSVSSFLQLVVAFTSPDVISTSPKNFSACRIDFTVPLLFEFLKKYHLPIGQVKNRIH